MKTTYNILLRGTDYNCYEGLTINHNKLLVSFVSDDDVQVLIENDKQEIIFTCAKILFFIKDIKENITVAVRWYYTKNDFICGMQNNIKINELLISNHLGIIPYESLNNKIKIIHEQEDDNNLYCNQNYNVNINMITNYFKYAPVKTKRLTYLSDVIHQNSFEFNRFSKKRKYETLKQ